MSKDKEDKTLSGLIRAALDGDSGYGEAAVQTPTGASLRLPLAQLAISTGTLYGEGRPTIPGTVEWLQGDADDSPIMQRLRIVPTPHTRGILASGSALPATTMQAERTSNPWPLDLPSGAAFPALPMAGDGFRFNVAAMGLTDAVDEDGNAVTTASAGDVFDYSGTQWVRQPSQDPVFGDHRYTLDGVVEVKTEVSGQSILQAGGERLDELVLEAHRLAVRDTLLSQVLAGDGALANLSGVAGVTGIGGASYPMSARGKDTHFTTGELAVEDADGRRPYTAWALGAALDTSAKTIAIDPGSSRRVVERNAISLSGLPAQRITDGLAGTTGLLADWRSVVVPVLDELIIVVDRITRPGEVRLTTRLPVADPIVTQPGAIYALTEL